MATLYRRKFFYLLLLPLLPAVPGHAQDNFQNVQRVVAVGDVHGDYDQFFALLQAAGVIDGNGAWTGGNTHLVQVGDVLDRGPDSRKVMDLLMDLEPQAQKAGGAVHALLGNHEAMNIYGDLRYVIPQDFASYRSAKSEELRDRYFKQVVDDLRQKGTPPANLEAFRKTFDEEHPLGWVEQRQAFSAEGKYGKWLRRHNAVIKINDVVFLHGGIGPNYASRTISDINRAIRSELSDFSKLQNGVTMDEEGPLWYRGLALEPEDALAAHVDRVLQNLAARHIVIGHTVGTAILPRFGGKVITIDVGLSKVYGGPPALLIIEDGKFYALHRGHKLQLPVSGEDPVPYLKAAAALDPPPSPILTLIESRTQLAKPGN